MSYASHRIVGVMELEPTRTLVKTNSIRTQHSLATRAPVAIRKINFELTHSRATPQVPFEPTVTVDATRLQRELEAELAELLGENISAV